MYATCLFCNQPLGANEALERFPVGRRLAFDAEKGRLWVVCVKCGRWNLTPLEERWEAIEQAERLFRDTRLRVSTENIGLARVAGDTDLVRIGRALRPELAAWRYGRQFARRRRVTALRVAGAAGGLGLGALALPGAGIAASVLLGGAYALGFASLVMRATGSRRFFSSRFVRDDEGQFLRITPNDLTLARLVAVGPSWGLDIAYHSRRPSMAPRPGDLLSRFSTGSVVLTGPRALEAARRLLPLVNGNGARIGPVNEAVALLDEWGDTERSFTTAAERVREWGARLNFGDTGALAFLPLPVRLALEMSAHEHQEQEALEGELQSLEQAWKDAEEVAAISDDLLVPRAVTRAFDRLRAGRRATPP